jgi:hypothetical protein
MYKAEADKKKGDGKSAKDEPTWPIIRLRLVEVGRSMSTALPQRSYSAVLSTMNADEGGQLWRASPGVIGFGGRGGHLRSRRKITNSNLLFLPKSTERRRRMSGGQEVMRLGVLVGELTDGPR